MDPALASLLLDLSDLSDEEAEQKTYREYVRLYMDRKTRKGMMGVRKTHDDEPVFFYEDRFNHAFFTAPNGVSRPYSKEKFDRVRASRVRWIGQVIRGNIDGTACWWIADPVLRNTLGNIIIKRLYVLWDEYYLIWLNPRKGGGWKFSSAYVADHRYIRKKTRCGRCFWRKKLSRD